MAGGKGRVRPAPGAWQEFLASEAGAGILLIACAVIAMIWANSPAYEAYRALKELPVALRLGSMELDMTLAEWVKHGLMSIFFLAVGLEIKRELLAGELADPRRAALAVIAAVGGMVVPAAIYSVVNAGGPGAPGWGIPMATDIAFALGVLSLLGPRVPVGLKVFLTAVAIVDDLGAVLVIALFYSGGLQPGPLLLMAVALAGALAYGRLARGQHLAVYLLFGLLAWYGSLQGGISPSVAAVLLALTVPMEATEGAGPARGTGGPAGSGTTPAHAAAGPLHRLEHMLSPWVTYAILPLFALLTAGVSLEAASPSRVTMGAFLGLLLGKPAGLLSASWLAVRAGWASLPAGTGWSAMAGAGLLAGIGFTMSLFIAGLAFDGTPYLDQAKIGVLTASAVAGIAGLAVLSAGTARSATRATR
ncbi:Na+/H+ antiporter NhaA [Thermaerobacter subterraneus]|uniref:Na(+)/H(+) antiporter NhaA n=1 Tax=Thermaerobacter subterraneus DSM 13965 TaxID=867903 RepID=K6P1R9_9FIRM|nr:Na+/H+ antiporter NhaA [Thermaerobacter subterraneus]EKP94985.1 sodium/proton antiporter, NhaA family [Thermaerobacter subterraneus DSM 13965]